MQAQYGQSDERNSVIHAKYIFLVYIDVEEFVHGTKVAYAPMIGSRFDHAVKARTSGRRLKGDGVTGLGLMGGAEFL
jgi:hypothetical protein